MEPMLTEPRARRWGGRAAPVAQPDHRTPERIELRGGLTGVVQRRRLVRRARAAAAVPFAGAAQDEPNVAALLRQTEGYVAARLRTDTGLRAAQDAVAAMQSALVEATNAAADVDGRTSAAIDAARGVDAHDSDQQVVWTAGARARAERRAASDAEAAARRRVADAEQRCQAESRRSIETALLDAEAGVAVAAAFLDQYNAACERRGRPGLGVLGRDVVEDIVLRALRPLDLDRPPGPPPGVREPDAEPRLPRPGTAHLFVH